MDRVIRAVAFIVTPIAFGAMGMLACYLDRGYSPVGGLIVGGIVGLGVAWFAIPFSRLR